MTPLDDLDLAPDRDDGPATGPLSPLDREPGDRSARLVVAAAAVLVACLCVAAWYWWSSSGEAVPPAPVVAGVPGDATDAAGGSERPDMPTETDLPPLDELDPVVRAMLQALSSRPELARLLATDNLLRRFVVSVENIGRGASPVRQLSGVRVDGQFSVERPYSASPVSQAAFARYDGLAATVADLDVAALADVYRQLRPRLQDAHEELGSSGTFDEAMEAAIVHLLQVSPNLASGAVQPVKGVTYAWVSPETENLSSAQKQLLRMGPANAARVQATLRALAQALGIPAERLPR